MFGWIGKAALVAVKEAHSLATSAQARDTLRLQMELRAERAKVVALERALASSQANVEWLRVMCNSLSNDRAAIAAVKGLELPAPQIEGRPRTPAEVERATVNQPIDATERTFTDIEDVDEALEAYAGHVNNFEDLGDEEADRQGIRHADDGTLEYAKR